jgi:hypothetical protein
MYVEVWNTTNSSSEICGVSAGIDWYCRAEEHAMGFHRHYRASMAADRCKVSVVVAVAVHARTTSLAVTEEARRRSYNESRVTTNNTFYG